MASESQQGGSQNYHHALMKDTFIATFLDTEQIDLVKQKKNANKWVLLSCS